MAEEALHRCLTFMAQASVERMATTQTLRDMLHACDCLIDTSDAPWWQGFVSGAICAGERIAAYRRGERVIYCRSHPRLVVCIERTPP
jgi:hypothetical protein